MGEEEHWQSSLEERLREENSNNPTVCKEVFYKRCGWCGGISVSFELSLMWVHVLAWWDCREATFSSRRLRLLIRNRDNNSRLSVSVAPDRINK